MIITRDAEKLLDKTQHAFIMKKKYSLQPKNRREFP
jgi:hypothetical protein